MLNTAQPAAYIRRSVARRGDPGDISREFQTEKVRALANGDGPTLRIIDGDWGRSASTDKTAQRTAFLALLEDIEQGRVSHVYAYSPDRLARSVEWSARLVNACRRAGASITTTAGTVAPDDPAARAMFNMLAVMNETALDEMERKARASAGTRKAHGEMTGGRSYGEVRTLKSGEVRGADEDAALVVATFHEAGSYFEAARRLNDRHVPARSGGQWYPRTVQRIVNRQDPTTARYGRRGVPSVSRLHRLAGLLRCHCGAVMGQTVSGEGTPRYRCPNGVADASHSRPYIVPERAILPWVKAEAGRVRLPKQVELADRDSRVDELTEDKRRLSFSFVHRGIDEPTYLEQLAAIDTELDRLDLAGRIVDVPRIDWTWPPERINHVLRTFFKFVVLDTAMHPVRAEWLLPPEYVA
jgi:DNA invertase Pin-like site-specific DNA recombinase